MGGFEYSATEEGMIASTYAGAKQFIDDIHANVITKAVEELNPGSEHYNQMLEVIRNGWGGRSEQAFEKQLDLFLEQLRNGLNIEYNNLSNGLIKLANTYQLQDQQMMEGE